MPRDVYARNRPAPTRLPYRVRTLGRVSGDGRHSTLGTYFDDAMLTVVRGGRGRYIHGAGTTEIGAGDVGLVLPGRDVGVLVSDLGDPYDHVYCRFCGVEALRVARRVARRRGVAFDKDRRYLALWSALTRAIAMQGAGSERGVALAVRDAAIVEVLAILDGEEDASAEREAAVWSADGLRIYLNDRVAQPIDLDRMAQDLGVSRSTLTRRCRAALGQSVRQAWESAKLELAAALLSRSSLRVGEVAERVGYEPFYFSRRFRERYGVSPRAWRDGDTG